MHCRIDGRKLSPASPVRLAMSPRRALCPIVDRAASGCPRSPPEGLVMQIEELASRDSYLDRAEGNVLEVGDGVIVLDRTVFYARGGGQPGDTGVIRWDGGEVRVLVTVRREGKIVHVVESVELPDPGTPVEGVIDWDRRYKIMRTHTALHALSGVVWRDFGAKVTGGNMDAG